MSTNSSSLVPLFIGPRRGVTTSLLVEGGRLIELEPLPSIPAGTRFAHDRESGWIAFSAPGQEGGRDTPGTLGLFHRDAPAHYPFAPLTLPLGHRVQALAFHRQVLYVGGHATCWVTRDGGFFQGKEIFGLFDLRTDAPPWTPVPLPEEVQGQGADKSIDEFLFDGDRLIAVDDIVWPKWLLLYDVRVPEAPALEAVHRIPNHGVYETIHSGALGRRWLALLSSSGPDIHRVPSVSLLDRRTFFEYGSFPGVERPEEVWRTEAPVRTWHSIALRGDRLLIAAGADGIGALDLSSLPWPSEPAQRIAFDRESEEHRVFSATCVRQLAYYPLPGRDVHHLQPVAGTPQWLALVCSAGVYDTVLLEGVEEGAPRLVG
jgi:hypothetical protein